MCCYKGNVTSWWSPNKKKCNEDRKKLAANIFPPLFSTRLTSDASRAAFDQRVALYSQIMKKGKLRAEWAGGNADIVRCFSENPIFACTCAFGDILINPQCANNYYKAPYALHDAFDLMEFIPIMKDVSASLMQLFKLVKACSIHSWYGDGHAYWKPHQTSPRTTRHVPQRSGCAGGCDPQRHHQL